MHGIFVDDMKQVPTVLFLLDEFLEKYSQDFEILGDINSWKVSLG